jgi:hypothetical protein
MCGKFESLKLVHIGPGVLDGMYVTIGDWSIKGALELNKRMNSFSSA